MVNCFLDGKQPLLTFADGVEVVKLLMACYYSAEREETVNPDAIDLLNFVPAVAKVRDSIGVLFLLLLLLLCIQLHRAHAAVVFAVFVCFRLQGTWKQ